MSLAMLEEAHDLLGGLVEQVVFLGGATTALWMTDPAAPAPRPTPLAFSRERHRGDRARWVNRVSANGAP